MQQRRRHFLNTSLLTSVEIDIRAFPIFLGPLDFGLLCFFAIACLPRRHILHADPKGLSHRKGPAARVFHYETKDSLLNSEWPVN